MPADTVRPATAADLARQLADAKGRLERLTAQLAAATAARAAVAIPPPPPPAATVTPSGCTDDCGADN